MVGVIMHGCQVMHYTQRHDQTSSSAARPEFPTTAAVNILLGRPHNALLVHD